MILVDTSIWFALLNARPRTGISEKDLLNFVTCGPVVQEVLQGLRDDARSEAFRAAFLSLPVLSDPLPLSLFLGGADIYRQGREKAYAIRFSTDCLIAAIAIQNKVPVWHKDRDFEAISKFTSLRIYRPA